MGSQEPDFTSQVADLNKYGQALNNCESVEEVVSLSLEAVSLLFGFPYTTFVEVRDGDLRVVHSTYPAVSAGDEPLAVTHEAFESGETTIRSGEAAGEAEDGVGATLAVPATIASDVVAIIVTRSVENQEFGDEVVRPLEILSTHAATAIGNIRSRERLERARRDLEKRKEMVEMYDRLLRHDLGNDLQVISAFSDEIAGNVDDEWSDYAERVHRTAEGAMDLIRRVGDLVSTLERQDEPTPRSLSETLSAVVADARDQYEELTVEFDAEAFDVRVYGGDLLDSVFTNVLTNAAVHNEGEVHVRVRLADASDDRVTVSIADDGRGVPDDVADRLFEMGVKSEDSDGTGFGLGFAKALTESYAGDIDVTESERGGADFRITLDRV
ncbi:sensor histidine kinase [Halorientalis regularis]|jgi:signal transduction histidine kinase|uniref:histidine kinase n=1 Tax=Halorientalis regularis TaxID=660518 RepID=A0A1G7MY18_9EURY|nr:ATP-binding protein [Halorientalis regularis]SDF65950.1 GAF domain-containing protein [Halorientalis regularis]